MNKLIKRIYFDDGDIQGKLDNAVETLQALEVGTTQEVDGITVTKQAEDSFIAAQDGDVVNVAVTPEGLSVTEVVPEVVEFSKDDVAKMWNDWKSESRSSYLKEQGFDYADSDVEDWSNLDFDQLPKDLQSKIVADPEFDKNYKLFDATGSENENVDIKTLMFSDEEIHGPAKVDIKTLMFSDEEIHGPAKVDIKTLMFSDEELGNDNVDIKTLMFSDEEIEASESELETIAPAVGAISAGKAEGDLITLDELTTSAEANGLSGSLQLIVNDLKSKGFTFDADATAKFFDDDEDDDEDEDNDSDSDLSDPSISNAQLFTKVAAENTTGTEDFNPELSNGDLFKAENSANGFKSLIDECKEAKY